MTTEDILAISKEIVKEKGFLDLSDRKMIWKSLGEFCYEDGRNYYDIINPSTKRVTIPLKKRVRLGEICVEKVLHLWDTKTNNDPKPKNLLKLINSYLYGKTSGETLYNECESFAGFWYVDVQDYDELYSMSAYTTTRLAYRALLDESFIGREYDDCTKDVDMDEAWDADYTASLAYSLCLENLGEWDKEKRREFWLWYINDAVPQVLNTKDWSTPKEW